MTVDDTGNGLLADDEALLKQPRLRRPRRTLLTTILQPFRISKRQAILLYTTLAILLLFLFGSPLARRSRPDRIKYPPRALHISHLRHIAGEIALQQDDVLGEEHAVVVDLPKDFKWIDGETRKEFSTVVMEGGLTGAAMGRMPGGGEYDMLVIGEGRRNLYEDREAERDFVNTTMIGFFVSYDEVLEEWRRAGPLPTVLELPNPRHPLPSSASDPQPCSSMGSAGPMNARFIWSDAGEPLAFFETTSQIEDTCQTLTMVDLRAVWPDFKAEMDKLGFGEEAGFPVRWGNVTELIREEKGGKEERARGWVPIFEGAGPRKVKSEEEKKKEEEEKKKKEEDEEKKEEEGEKDGEDKEEEEEKTGVEKDTKKEVKTKTKRHAAPSNQGDAPLPESQFPFFASNVFPREILWPNPKLDPSHRAPGLHTTTPVVLAKPYDLTSKNKKGEEVAMDFACLDRVLPKEWGREEVVRHVTPLQRVTFCERGQEADGEGGECEVGANNTVLLGVLGYDLGGVHAHMFITTELYPPFDLISVSPPLHLASRSSSFSPLTLTFLPTTSSAIWGENPYTKSKEDTPSGWLSHGWLNDTLVIGGGVDSDGGFATVQMGVREAVRGHEICKLGGEYGPVKHTS